MSKQSKKHVVSTPVVEAPVVQVEATTPAVEAQVEAAPAAGAAIPSGAAG